MKSFAFLSLFAASAVLAAPVEKRAVIAHDAVRGFPQTVPDNAIGQLMLRHKPYLQVQGGCVPFPAVDAAGNTGGGLNPSGSPSDGCNSSPGQVYARAGTHNGRFGIMYAWYMPKDTPGAGLGHRHDWESVVVWLSGSSGSPSVMGVAASAHGEYQKTTTPDLVGATSPTVRYFATWPVNHQLGFTSSRGGQQPLVAWESLTPAARAALQDTSFGSANVQVKDGNFQNLLAKAN